MDENRKELYEKIEEMRQSKLIVYVTSDRIDFGAQISDDAVNYILKHLDTIGKVDKISLYLYTLGGDILAAWNIVNLIRQFCSELEIIVPWKARSAGTLMCLGANNIIMTKQATLGPIGPSYSSNDMYINVEEVQGFLELAKNELNIKDDIALSNIFNILAEKINPLVLGRVYRGRNQIRMLARKLLKKQVKDEANIERIISFLCSESGSHNYTIDRIEAGELGLNIEKPSDDLYNLIKNIHNSISDELGLSKPYNLKSYFDNNIQKEDFIKRIIIESIDTGSFYYIYGRKINKNNNTMNPEMPMVERNDNNYSYYEGWISDIELGKINNHS